MTETLPHRYYHDADIFAWEKARVFPRHWWLVGAEAEITVPGEYLAFVLIDRPLLVVRDAQQQLRGFYNLCRHRAGPLVADSSGRCREFVCRYHGWRYACSGELLRTPGFEADALGERTSLGLLPVRVGAWNGLVFVCLDESAPDLDSWLGDVLTIASGFDTTAAMRFDGKIVKQACANWKTYGDNSCEGYHVGMVHRDLGSSIRRESVTVAGYDNGGFVGFDVRYGDGRDPSRAGKGFWVYKFPGLLLHFSDFAFNAESVVPRAVDRIELHRWFWSDPVRAAAHGVDPATIQPKSEQVMDEDIGICESVQRNLASGAYPGGMLSATQEPGTIYFQQQVRAALGGFTQSEHPGAKR